MPAERQNRALPVSDDTPQRGSAMIEVKEVDSEIWM